MALLGCCAAVAGWPLSALAASGGASASGDSSSRDGSGSSPAAQAPRFQTARGDGFTLSTPTAGMLHGRVTFSGSVAGSPAGSIVTIQRRGRQTAGVWTNTTRGTTDSHGGFAAVWPVDHIGRFQIRAILSRGEAHAAAASPELSLTIYREALATVYGPGFYGSRTACGEILRRNTIGVANRTLPCGTRVAVLYRGRTLIVPVIDRGPYANGADWDLTEATARSLGIDGTVRLGAVSLPSSG